MTDTGVVDPIRVPDWLRRPAEEAWRGTPPLARLFIGLALLDILSRALGILQPRYDLGADLFGAYVMLVPHDLWVLLPAVLLFRRPDAASVTPLVVWGAAVVAVVTVVERPLENLLNGPFGPSTLSLEVSILAALAVLVAYVLIARGLALLNPAQPTPAAAGFSNLILGLGLIGIVVQLAQSVAGSGHTGVPSDGLLALSNVVAAGRLVAWLYLLWIVVRGLGDSRRPEVALLAALIGAAITGLFDPITAVGGAVLASLGPGIASGVVDLQYALGLLSIGVGQALVIVSFALGLAEPPVPYGRPPSEAPGSPA